MMSMNEKDKALAKKLEAAGAIRSGYTVTDENGRIDVIEFRQSYIERFDKQGNLIDTWWERN